MLRTFLARTLMTSLVLFSLPGQSKGIDKSGQVQPAQSRKEYCNKAVDPNYFRSLFYGDDNHLAFTNHGGIGDGGVCWWHSMFTRNATYLAVYKPDLPRVHWTEAEQIIEDIVSNRGVVEIAGYRNLAEFSKDYAREIQRALERWQIGDGGLLFGWLRGLHGTSPVSGDKMRDLMDETYEQIDIGRVAYQMLQIPGITSHAWLVVDMKKGPKGYDLEVLDSNYLSMRTVHYTFGMGQLKEYHSVPYTGRNTFPYWSYATAKSNYCRFGLTAQDLRERDQANR